MNPRATRNDEIRWAAAPEADPRWPKVHALVGMRRGGERTEYRAHCGYVFSVDQARPLQLQLRADASELAAVHPDYGQRTCGTCRAVLGAKEPVRSWRGRQLDLVALRAGLDLVITEADLLSRLRRVAHAQGRNPHWPCDWGQGGCLILAEGVRRLVGGDLVGVSDEYAEFDEEYDGGRASHVVLRTSLQGEDVYLDSHGHYRDERELVGALMRRGFSEPELFPYKTDDHIEDEIPFDEGLVARLTERLDAALRTQRD